MNAVNPFGFLGQWDAWYPGSAPVAYVLRDVHPDRWIRIYSLPGGQRYPGTDADWTELLHRHITAAAVLLGEGTECALVAAHLADSPDGRWFATEFDLEPLGLIGEHVANAPESEDDAIDLWVARATWEPTRFEPAIRRRAEDKGPSFLLVALETGYVYAPYDGGADLFAPDPARRAEFRMALRAWVSPRRDGL